MFKKYSLKFFSQIYKSIPNKMKFISITNMQNIPNLTISEKELPVLSSANERMIKIEAFALNRGDILQKQGKYPPPKGVTDVLGLECSGYLVENDKININKKVMCLLPGGGYAEFTKVHKDHIIEIPSNIDVISAAAIPEAWITSLQLLTYSKLKENEYSLIHAASSGIGTALMQLIKLRKGISIALCSTEEKIKFCKNLIGEDHVQGVMRNNENKTETILNLTNKKGCDLIFDCVGASEFENNLNCAAMDCRWIQYGMMGGNKIKDFDMNKFIRKRIHFICSTLRNRSDEYKTELIKSFVNEIIPHFKSGGLIPVIDKIYSFEQINEAHKRMECNENIGKILIRWN